MSLIVAIVIRDDDGVDGGGGPCPCGEDSGFGVESDFPFVVPLVLRVTR